MPRKPGVVPFERAQRQCLKALRELAKDTASVFLSAHAKERMQERNIVLMDVYRTLWSGEVHSIELGAGDDVEDKVVLQRHVPATGKMAVVTLVCDGKYLKVVTVMWRSQP